MDKKELIREIKKWRMKRNAVILAHNYQIPEIQDLADFVGDSLQLSQEATRTDTDLIVFCGVHFMAETAAILNPDKKVLIPDLKAGCSLADSIDAETLRTWKKKYPNAVVVSYVNTSAEVKSESDYCCTSANAVKVVQRIPEDKEIIFTPDLFLGDYVAKITGRKNIYVYPGECHVHANFQAKDVIQRRQQYPKADFLIHPECGCSSSCMHQLARKEIPEKGTYILSTGGMIRHAKTSKKKDFIVGTEIGIIHRLKKENPDKKFIPLKNDAICKYMKMITLENLLDSLIKLQYEVKIPEEIAKKALKPIQRMLEIV